MKLADVLAALRRIAPEPLAESWDKVGLHLGDPAWQVMRGLLCIDLTPAVLREAMRRRVQIIVAYHPPIFAPITRLTTNDWKERLLMEAAQRCIALYSPHTALDAAPGGVNDWLAKGLGEGQVSVIRPAAAARQYKLVTFVPAAALEPVLAALATAGAGHIGAYSHCAFSTAGEGTFRGDATTHPAVGRRGRRERVPEQRLEMVCPADRLTAAVAALRQAHPYEEPAFDVYPLAAVEQTRCGQGRVVTLDKPVTPATLVARVKRRLRVAHLEVAKPQALARVRRIGLCAGAGGSLLDEAGDIDAFVTGEMRHHDVLAATQRGVAVLLAGHTQTERPYLPTYRRHLRREVGAQVHWFISTADRPPGKLM